MANTRFVNGGETYIIDVKDNIVNCNSTIGAIVLVLPPITSAGFNYLLRVNDISETSETNNITIVCSSTNKINALSSFVIATNGIGVNVTVNSENDFLLNGAANGGGGGMTTTVVENYSALPAPETVSGQFFWCENSQGTKWLPFDWGGTYYPSGMYYSNGISWGYMQVPYQASQSTVNTGTVTDQFVSPSTLNNYSGWNKTKVGLGNVDNTSDLDKPISTATQSALDNKVDKNVSISGATKTKITYDTKGLITSGADATTADIADSSNKRYVTDANLVVIGNTSGTNTGDNSVNTNSNTYADGKVADAISNGITTIAPSQNAVFDALTLKQNNITLTTNGQEGAATIIGDTLNIPIYSNNTKFAPTFLLMGA